MRHLQKSGIITLKALGSPIGSRTAQVQEQQLEETKFIAFFMGKKIDIDGKDLYDAKQKAITQLKVPKSKVGLLAVVSAESQRNQDFKFESVNEGKSYSNKFSAWFTGTVLNSVKHPTYGKHQLTPDQIEKSSGDYKNKLFKAIDMAVKNGDITPNIIRKNESVNESIKYNNDGFVTQMINAAGKVVKDITLDGETFSLKGNKYISKKGGKDLHKSHFGIKESVNEGKKAFKINPPIGSSKYSISAHDGITKHKDGSPFYNILIFKNKADLERRANYFRSEKYIEESINEENPGLWANIRAKRERGEAPAPKNSQAYKDAVAAGKEINKEQKSLKREALKSIVREVMQEEAEYQKFFQKVLDKAGKSIPSMSDDEKKAFFNKVDSAWSARGEKNELVMKEGIWPKSKLSGQFQMQLSLQLKKHFKGVFYSVGYDLYHNDKKILTIDGDEDSINSVVAKLKSKIR